MNILTNFPYSPFTRKAGSGQRFLQALMGLRELGHQVIIWSIEQESLYKWSEKDMSLASELAVEVVLTPSWNEIPTIPKLDLIYGTYYNFVPLFKDYHLPIVCDTHDILSVNEQINEFFKKNISKVGSKNTFRYSPRIFNNPTNNIFPISLAELSAYQSCNKVITISKHETNRLRGCGLTNVFHIPYIATNNKFTSTHSGSPISGGSANLNNLFVNDLLGEIIIPQILLRCPDFKIDMLGEINNMCYEYPGINYLGYTENEQEIYNKSRFGILGYFYGTGSAIKAIEWMASNIPIISFKCYSGADTILDNETGYIVNSISEFIDRAIELYRNPKLCQRLGQNAKEYVLSYYSKDRYLKDLEEVLTSPPTQDKIEMEQY